MSQEIEELQKEKLRREIKELKRPLILRSQFILVMLAVAGLFTQGTLSHIRSERAELHIEEANKKLSRIQFVRDSAQKELDSLTFEIKGLEAAKQNQTKRSNHLIETVSESAKGNIPTKVKSAVLSLQNSFFSIALYGYNVDQSTFNRVRDSLLKDGYSLTNAQLLSGPRRNWLATRPTVLYYDPQTKKIAEIIAEKLSLITRKTFIWQEGAGFGIPKDSSQKSLRIHIVE